MALKFQKFHTSISLNKETIMSELVPPEENLKFHVQIKNKIFHLRRNSKYRVKNTLSY